MSEASPETTIQFQATMPVSCLPQFSDACKITLELSHDPELGGKKCIGTGIKYIVWQLNIHIDENMVCSFPYITTV